MIETAKAALIEMNFAQAKAQARKLDEIAADMKKLSKHSMADSIHELSGSWKGESATAYFAKSELLRGNIENTAQQISEIADNIRATAQRIYEAEMAALQIIQTRTSGTAGGGGGTR